MKCFILILLSAAAAWATPSLAGEAEVNAKRAEMGDESEAHSVSGKRTSVEMRAYVLSAVRREIESNPASKVVSLSIDPDYKGGTDSYLVNVVLVAQEHEFSVGVFATCIPVSGGWKAEVVAFLD